MASYNGDFNKMQEEALLRLREMQNRSRTAVNRPRENAPSPKTPHQEQTRRQEPQPKPQPTRTQQNKQQNPDPLKAIFGDMKIDSEKALILLTLYILYKNKSDPKLLLALGYLLI